jgi:hypothetical protein
MIRWAAVLTLIVLLCPGLAEAQNSPNSYIFLLASGFLCDPSDSSACPATARATQGDSYEVSGAGAFDAQNKLVKASGTFTHKSTNGNVLQTGVWTASELVSFVSYGIAPNALLHEKRTLGPPQFGPKNLKTLSGPKPTGGLAVLRIVLQPISGATKTAVLQMNCALGDVPRERSVEGIRLTFDNGSGEFSEEVGGRVMFLAMRPEVNAATKSPRQEPATGTAGPPNN